MAELEYPTLVWTRDNENKFTFLLRIVYIIVCQMCDVDSGTSLVPLQEHADLPEGSNTNDVYRAN